MKDRKIIITEDGSSSIYIPELNEGYHSSHGAVNESNHIFIEHGLSQIKNEEITIFEMGFGTGLNAFLTLIFALENNKKVNYYTIEKYPLSVEEIQSLNYGTLFPQHKDELLKLHNTRSGKPENINANFTFTKIIGDLKDFTFGFKHDVCFFDAFSPDVQADLWTVEIFKRIFDSMTSQGILCTYSAKGEVRRNLKAAGFTTEKLSGPTGKREITRAWKDRGELVVSS